MGVWPHEGEGHESIWHHEGEGYESVWHHDSESHVKVGAIMVSDDLMLAMTNILSVKNLLNKGDV